MFDFLTGNWDRVRIAGYDKDIQKFSNNLPFSMAAPKMWFIDNEFGLTAQPKHNPNPLTSDIRNKLLRLLKTSCIFQRRVAEKVVELGNVSSPGDYMGCSKSNAQNCISQ